MWASAIKLASEVAQIVNRSSSRKYKKKVLKLKRALYVETHKERPDDKKIFDYINELNRVLKLFGGEVNK